MHLLRRSLKEPPAPAQEQRVSREYYPLVLLFILHEPADAVLCVAGCVQALDFDFPEREALAVSGCLSHTLTVLSADDVKVLGKGEV